MTVPINASVTSRMLASISRRRSLMTIATLALTGASTGSSSAKRGRRSDRKAKRKPKQMVEQLCLAQVDDCQDMLFALCGDRDDPDACAAPSLPCCESFASCDATSALECFFSVSVTIAAGNNGRGPWLD